MQDVRDLAMLIDSRVPLIILETHDEPRALQLLTRVAIKRSQSFYVWSSSDGLQPLGFGARHIDSDDSKDPEKVLRLVRDHDQPALYALCDYHPYLKDEPTHVRLLKDIALDHERLHHTVVLVSHKVDIPPEIRRYCAKFSLSLPDDAQLMAIIRSEIAAWSKSNNNLRIITSREVLKKLIRNLRGLTEHDARRLARGIIRDDGAINEEDLPALNRLKFELMDMESVLSFEYDTEKFSNVGGLNNLKAWVRQRERAFLDSRTNNALEPPKGVMLLGIQGSGKSLAAKAIAGLWGVPLLRLDIATLYNKFIGESERNLRESLEQADLMAPCVLWIDEIEKGISVSQTDNSTSQRMLGTLLTWMAERKSSVFLVATSNDVTSLPPELIRKGRLDEIFFVDLPTSALRQEIIAIHLAKRGFDPVSFDTELLAEQSDGFSGAELEQAVVAALYSVSAAGEALSTEHILREIDSTYPLSVTMGEKINALRQWSSGRTVLAD